MARRLALARHAPGFDAIGWVLLGFLLGAGLAVFALLHADLLVRPALPAEAKLAAPPVPPPMTAPARPPIADVAPASALSFVPPSEPPDSTQALVSAGAASAKRAPASRLPAGPTKPRPSPAGADAQVADDAAAAGLTSRSAGDDLY